jgi:putative IMPACT (imprinted ancient) family translation regulator
MARAYALAVQSVLKQASFTPYEKEFSYIFKTSYAEVDKVLYLFRQLQLIKFEREFDIQEVTWKVLVNKMQIEALSECYKLICSKA